MAAVAVIFYLDCLALWLAASREVSVVVHFAVVLSALLGRKARLGEALAQLLNWKHQQYNALALPMLRLLSSKEQGRKEFLKTI